MKSTNDCEPTLTDTQVLEFCKNGFVMLEGVVPDEINRRTFEFIETHGHAGLLQEEWFVEEVLLNAQAGGAVRSLLGRNFALPKGMANHRMECPAPNQSWHRDGGSRYAPELNHLQVFYYPQDAPVEMGAHGSGAGFPFFLLLAELDVALRGDSRRSQNRRARGIDFPHRLFNMASSFGIHCARDS